jgi:hypothetical protein
MKDLMLLNHKKKNREESEMGKSINGSHLICLCLHITDEPPVGDEILHLR